MRILIAVILLAFAGVSLAPNHSVAAAEQQRIEPQTIALDELLEAVSRKSGERFLQHSHIRSDVVIGEFRARDVTLETLHTVLRNNGLAAVTVDDFVSIIPVSLVRQHVLRGVDGEAVSIPGDEWVLRVLQPERAYATHLVPLLRPLVPQAGHLVGHANSNSLILVAPYDVARQIADVVATVDANSSPQE